MIELLGRMGVSVTIDDKMRVEVDAGTIQRSRRAVRAGAHDARVDPRARPAAGALRQGRRVAAGRLRDRRAAGEHSRRRACSDGRRRSRSRTATSAHARSRLRGARLVLETVTVTGTENLLMAAALAEGETIIENAAREPEVVDLANFLTAMGAKIAARAPTRSSIQGVERLHGAQLRRAAGSHRDRHLPGRRRDHRRARARQGHAARSSRRGAGEAARGRRARSKSATHWIELDMRGRRPRAVDIRTAPYPAFPDRHAGAVRGAQHRRRRRRRRSPRRSSRTASCTCWRCGGSARTFASKATRRSSAACRG